MPKDLAVIIPVHKEKMNPYEQISFLQCVRILKHREIHLIIPESISSYEYQNLYPDLIIIKIQDSWFESLQGYNLFKLSNFFYTLFEEYNYILTYELDSYIFKDDLDYWMNLNIDYIGAPWFDGYNEPVSNNIIGVGNSGFSLRKRSRIHAAMKTYFNKPPIFFFRKKRDYDHQLKELNGIYEDWFIANRLSNLNLAVVEQAIAFSFEVNPHYLFQKNKLNLPTGCHGWYKYEVNFWKPFIEADHKIAL